jgi:hypothetical protein
VHAFVGWTPESTRCGACISKRDALRHAAVRPRTHPGLAEAISHARADRVESGLHPTTTNPQNLQAKKNRPVGRSFRNQTKSDYLVAAAEAATSAAVEAAEAASAAAADAVAAAAAASAAGVAAASVAAGATVVVSVVVVVAGASAAAGVVVVVTSASFFEQAARATAIRETISRDFFMIFSLIKLVLLLRLIITGNYRSLEFSCTFILITVLDRQRNLPNPIL